MADMVEEALDKGNAMGYAPVHEKAMPGLQEDLRFPYDVADILQPGVQGEGLPAQTQEGSD